MEILSNRHCCSSFVQWSKTIFPEKWPSGLLLRAGRPLPTSFKRCCILGGRALFLCPLVWWIGLSKLVPELVGKWVSQKRESYCTIASLEPKLPLRGQGERRRCRLEYLHVSKEGQEEGTKNHNVGENRVIASTFIKLASFVLIFRRL